MALLFAGVGVFLASCGPDLFKGSWVYLKVDGREVGELESTKGVTHWPASIFAYDRYRLVVEDDLELGWPDVEEKKYFGNDVQIERSQMQGYERIDYSSRRCESSTYGVIPYAEVEVKYVDYGLVSGTFRGRLCGGASKSVPQIIEVEGRFSGSLKE